MIKIYDKIWWVVSSNNKLSNERLAYMCQYETDTEGNPKPNIAKMQSTGRSWAGTRENTVYKRGEKEYYARDEEGNLIVDYVEPAKFGEEFIHDNNPTIGFSVGDSVCRWSTQNKLFRVKDPRGFVVEIPSGNLATLLHHCTVVKGIVQEACVWGRDGNNHILLPVNSEPYLETLSKMKKLAEALKVKDLKEGDRVKFFGSDTEYIFCGRVRLTWRYATYRWVDDPTRPRKTWGWDGGYYEKVKEIFPEAEYRDGKWRNLFVSLNTDGTPNVIPKADDPERRYLYGEFHTNPKIVSRVPGEPIVLDDLSVGIPYDQRDSNAFFEKVEVIKIEKK